jgi:D-alanyl-D-alanine-carboxypeptidase/D-alanyl-D-alanine-endopeptidase
MRTSPMPRHGIAVLLAALVLLAPVGVPAQGHFPSTEDAQLMLRYLVEDGETPGIVLAFIDEDGSTRVLQYGDAGPDTRPLGRRSVFEIGSITKTFTAALLADMVARGEMSLDDPVQDYLPEGVTMPGWEGRPITLMDLSTHHSGLPRMPDNFEPADPENPYADYTTERLYAFLSSHQLRREPGSEYEYSNLAVGLLGHVLELATGRPYETLVRERILQPLGMTTTGITLEGDLATWMTTGHNPAGDVVSYWDVATLAGAGGLRSNADDMLTYLAAQLDPPENHVGRALRITHEPRVELENGGAGGLGWGIRELDGRRILTHGGGTAGYSTMVGFDPVIGVGVVMLTNTGGFGDDLGSDLLRRGAPISTPTVEVPRSVLEGYAGMYETDPDEQVAIRLEEEGWLTMQVPDNVRFRLYADSDTSFYTRRTPWRVVFRTDEQGRATGLRADLGGTERMGERVDRPVPDPRVLAGNPILRDDLPRLTAAELAPYEGRYAAVLGGNTLVFRVFVEDGELRAQPEGQRSTRLVYQGDHAFIAAIDADVRLVFHPEGGRVDRVTLHDGDRAAPGERLEPGGSPPEPEAPDVLDLPVSAEDVARYEGTYLLEIGARTLPLRIFGRDGRLVSQARGQSEAPLRYQGDHTFVPDFDDNARLVFTVEDGRATSVTLHQGGGVFQGQREGG